MSKSYDTCHLKLPATAKRRFNLTAVCGIIFTVLFISVVQIARLTIITFYFSLP